MGDYVLAQQDIQTGKNFPDSVAYGGMGYRFTYTSRDICKDTSFFCVPVNIYNIPFRCLYSKNVENLMDGWTKY